MGADKGSSQDAVGGRGTTASPTDGAAPSIVEIFAALPTLDVTILRQIADECEENIDRQMGNCPCCYGTGKEWGDPDFECCECGGVGTFAAYDAEMNDEPADDGTGGDPSPLRPPAGTQSEPKGGNQ